MNDDQLEHLLSDAVSEVDPANRLEEIRACVRSDSTVVPMSGSRSWVPGVVGTAAVIGIVAYATGAIPGMDRSSPLAPTTVGPSHSPRPGGDRPSRSPAPGSAQPGRGASHAYAVYYVGSSPSGRAVLFREWHPWPAGSAADPAGGRRDVLTEAVGDAISTTPDDPDYESPWQGHAGLEHASYRATGTRQTLQVTFEAGAPVDRPAGMSAGEARAAIQQLVYTAQAAIGKREPVRFAIARQPSTARPTLLGVDISHPVANAPPLRTLSPINISSPEDGAQASGTLHVTGVDNGFEGTVVVCLERGGKRYLTTRAISGTGGGRMRQWSATLDLSTVSPGTYTLLARNHDPSAPRHRPWDTRTVEVR